MKHAAPFPFAVSTLRTALGSGVRPLIAGSNYEERRERISIGVMIETVAAWSKSKRSPPWKGWDIVYRHRRPVFIAGDVARDVIERTARAF